MLETIVDQSLVVNVFLKLQSLGTIIYGYGLLQSNFRLPSLNDSVDVLQVCLSE